MADGLFGDVFGTAHADRCSRCLHPVIVVVALADRAADRAQRAAHEEEEAALAGAVESVLVDAEGRAWLQREDRPVGEADLHAPVGAGADDVATLELGARGNRRRRRRAALDRDAARRDERATVGGDGGLQTRRPGQPHKAAQREPVGPGAGDSPDAREGIENRHRHWNL